MKIIKTGLCKYGGKHEFIPAVEYYKKHKFYIYACGIMFCDKCGLAPDECYGEYPACLKGESF